MAGRNDTELARNHPALLKDSPDYDVFLDRLAAGWTLSKAAEYVGYKWPSLRRMIEAREDLRLRFEEAARTREQALRDEAEEVHLEIMRDEGHPKRLDAADKVLRAHDPRYKPSADVTTVVPVIPHTSSVLDSLSVDELKALAAAARQPKQIEDAEVVRDDDGAAA